jgi:glutathione S-transferase
LANLCRAVIKTAPVPFFVRWLPALIGGRVEQQVTPRAVAQLDFLETQLATAPGGGPFVAGDKLTGADIMVLFPLQASAKRLGITKSSHPKVTEYVARLEAIASYKASVEKIIEKEGSYGGAAL